jgi:hypothetical protein
VKIGWRGGGKVGVVDLKAVGKLLAVKPAHAEAISNALGPVWCSMHGVDCREIGENVFMFTFKQEGEEGRRSMEVRGSLTRIS